jgi:hypothetical protein
LPPDEESESGLGDDFFSGRTSLGLLDLPVRSQDPLGLLKQAVAITGDAQMLHPIHVSIIVQDESLLERSVETAPQQRRVGLWGASAGTGL